jgi:O-antigen/teichoic acid export membrane protein
MKMIFSKESSSVKSLINGSFFTLIINGFSAVLTFALHIFLARMLGHEHYSNYAYAFTVLTLMSTLAVAGMDIASQRFISGHNALSEWSLINGFLRRAFQLTLFVSLIFAFILAVVVSFFTNFLGENLSEVLIIVAIVLPFCTLLLLAVSILRGFRHPVLASLPRLIFRPILLAIFVVVIIYFCEENVSATLTMIIDLIVTTIALLVASIFIFKIIPQNVLESTPIFTANKWTSIILPLFSVSCFQMFIRSSDILIIGMSLDIDSSGSYTAASRVAQLAAFGLMAINGVLPALISRHHAKNEKHELQKLVTMAATATFIFSLISSLVIFVFAPQILNLFGFEFLEAVGSLRLLAIGQLINAMTGSVGFLLTMTGSQMILFKVLLITSVANILLCVILIPMYGIFGGAMATSISVSGSNIVLAFYSYKVVGIDPSILNIFRKTKTL